MFSKQYCGVYSIKSKATKKIYFGSAKNLVQRKERHLRDLVLHRHHNKALQRIYDLHGRADLVFRVVHRTKSREHAYDLEQKLIQDPKYADSILNVGYHAKGGDNLTRNPNRKKIVEKIRVGVQDFMDSLDDDDRIALRSRPGAMNGMYGKTHSPETCAKAAERMRGNQYALGVKRSEMQKKVLSEKALIRASSAGYVNPFKGRRHTVETKQKLAEANRGNVPPNAIRVKVGKRIYRSFNSASRITGIDPNTLRYRARSPNFPEVTVLTD